jgi:phospholipase/carboxylesterase
LATSSKVNKSNVRSNIRHNLVPAARSRNAQPAAAAWQIRDRVFTPRRDLAEDWPVGATHWHPWLARGLLLAICALSGCKASEREPRPTAPRAAPPPTSARAPSEGAARALTHIEIVTGGAAANSELPLVIALHGLGDQPKSFADLFAGFDAPARIAVLQAPEAWGDGYAWFGLSAGNLDATAAGIRNAAQAVARSIRIIASQRPTRGPAIVTGFSQGGALSFALAAAHADVVRLAIPVAGWLPQALHPASGARTDATGGVRVIALHGAADTRIPLDAARQAVSGLQRAGYPASLEVFSGVGHHVPAELKARLHALLAQACREAR